MKASSASFAVVAASLAFLNINPSPNSRKRNFQSQQRLRREGGETEEDRKARREKEPGNRSKGSSLRSDSRENLRYGARMFKEKGRTGGRRKKNPTKTNGEKCE